MAHNRFCIGRGIASIRHRTHSRSYTYYAVHSIQLELKAFEAEGTVFGSISKKDFKTISWIIPPEPIVIMFEHLLYPIDQLIENNENESELLINTHDILLPKLITGEIRVPEAESFTEEAFFRILLSLLMACRLV